MSGGARGEGRAAPTESSQPPPHIDERAIVLAIDPSKDVDGFHPVNVAKLALEDPGGFVPCTPLGCQRLLGHYKIQTKGARVVVVGRSMIVGKPIFLAICYKLNTIEFGNASLGSKS